MCDILCWNLVSIISEELLNVESDFENDLSWSLSVSMLQFNKKPIL